MPGDVEAVSEAVRVLEAMVLALGAIFYPTPRGSVSGSDAIFYPTPRGSVSGSDAIFYPTPRGSVSGSGNIFDLSATRIISVHGGPGTGTGTVRHIRMMTTIQWPTRRPRQS
jgi:hypothetical protein